MSRRILIIDDDEQDRKGMMVALKKEGYAEVVAASTEDEGLALARTFRPEVVVVDVLLPRQDGFDVCQALRAIDGLSVKIIVITGHLEAVNAAKARVSGADEILEKSAGFKDIHKTIQRILG